MKRNPVWIFASIVVLLLASTLLWNFGSLGIAVRHPNILRFRKRRRNHGFNGLRQIRTDQSVKIRF